MKGKFIVLEGIDGCGKETQTELLIKYFEQKGISLEKASFPNYGSPGAYFVEQYLKGKYGSADEIPPQLAAWFFTLDRFDVKDKILVPLEAGKVVISNRYVSSNAGHQGGKIKDVKKRQEFLDSLYYNEYELCKNPKPNLQIYLHIPAEIAQELVDKKSPREYIEGKKRDIHEEDKEHLKHAEESYNYISENELGWEKVECMQGNKLLKKEEIHNKIISLKGIEEIVKEFSNFS